MEQIKLQAAVTPSRSVLLWPDLAGHPHPSAGTPYGQHLGCPSSENIFQHTDRFII